METVLVGAAMVGSMGTAWVLQKFLLGAMLYAIDPRRRVGQVK